LPVNFSQVNNDDEDEDEEDDLPALIGTEDALSDTITVDEDPALVLGTPRTAGELDSVNNINNDYIMMALRFSESHALETADAEADISATLLNLYEQQTPAQPIPMDTIRSSAPLSSAAPFMSNFAAAASLWESFERRGLDVD
jgi:hypothetical protein